MRGRGVKWLASLAQGHITAWAQKLGLLLTKCVTLGKSLNFSVHQFLHKARLMTVPSSLITACGVSESAPWALSMLTPLSDVGTVINLAL